MASPTVGCFLRLSIGRFNLVKGDQKTDSVCKTMPGIKFGHHLHYPYSPNYMYNNYDNDDDDKNDNDGNSNNINNMINQWANKALH